jgi:hypothetical protein
MMLYDQQEVARHQVQDRVGEALRRTRYDAGDCDAGNSGPRHRMAVALRRMADRLEPPPVPQLRHRRRLATTARS